MLGATVTAPAPKLYVQPASPPCAAVEAALTLKSIPYARVDLMPMSQLLVGPLRWGTSTVPGMRIGSERVAGSRSIMRKLDALAPEPPLLPPPGDPRYARVLELERWGDEVLQPVLRRLLPAAFLRRPQAMESYIGDARLPVPIGVLRRAAPVVARLLSAKSKLRDGEARTDLAALPRQLERIDGWVGEGLLGGEQPNAADLQIGAIIRSLMSVGDVRPLIAERPAARLTRYFPPIAGELEAGVLPAEWLAAPAAEGIAQTRA
jgi:glutathione S-transferase